MTALGVGQKESLDRAANWHRQELVLSPPAQPQKLHNANITMKHDSCSVALFSILVMLVTHLDENCYAPRCKLLFFFPCVFQNDECQVSYCPATILTTFSYLSIFLGISSSLHLCNWLQPRLVPCFSNSLLSFD